MIGEIEQNGYECTVGYNKSRELYYIDINNISVVDISKIMTITRVEVETDNGTENYDINCSVSIYDYMKKASLLEENSNHNINLKLLMKSLYLYTKFTQSYIVQ